MSYCRFGEGDVYVFPSSLDRDNGLIDCCACILQKTPDQVFGDNVVLPPAEMIEHLKAHRAAGHNVPDFVFEAIISDFDLQIPIPIS